MILVLVVAELWFRIEIEILGFGARCLGFGFFVCFPSSSLRFVIGYTIEKCRVRLYVLSFINTILQSKTNTQIKCE